MQKLLTQPFLPVPCGSVLGWLHPDLELKEEEERSKLRQQCFYSQYLKVQVDLPCQGLSPSILRLESQSRPPSLIKDRKTALVDYKSCVLRLKRSQHRVIFTWDSCACHSLHPTSLFRLCRVFLRSAAKGQDS